MADDVFFIKQGDLLPVITGVCRLRGKAVNLTGAVVRFKMRLKSAVGNTPSKVNAVATITDAVAGLVEYAWVGTDTDTLGEYEYEWEATWGATPMHFPNDRQLPLEVGRKLP